MSTCDINTVTITAIVMFSTGAKDLASKLEDELFVNDETNNEEDTWEDAEERAEEDAKDA